MNTNENRRKGFGIRKRTLVGVLAVLVACTLFASGALLSYYGQVTTKADVMQSVVVSSDSGATWNNYDAGITTDIKDMVHCHPYWFKYWIWNRANCEVPVNITEQWLQSPGGDPTGYNYANYIVGDYQTIKLRQKDTTTWGVINEGTIGADLTIKNCRNGFWYKLNHWGLTGGDYALIYYANYPDYWTEGPVTVIDTFTISGTGSFEKTVSGIQSFPYPEDENAQRPIFNDSGETYLHQYGAKLWLVPSSVVSGDKIISWDWDEWLWETDLALFINCGFDLPEHYNPVLYSCYNVETLQPETKYCWLNYNYVVANIMPGTYKYLSKLVVN